MGLRREQSGALWAGGVRRGPAGGACGTFAGAPFGSTLAIALAFASVTQSMPSGPAAIPSGTASAKPG